MLFCGGAKSGGPKCPGVLEREYLFSWRIIKVIKAKECKNPVSTTPKTETDKPNKHHDRQL